jgi:MFS family permease
VLAVAVALALELVAAALFVAEPALPVLLVARLVTGLGVGLLAPTATAYLHDLDEARRPGASAQRFEIVSTAANIGGLGVGPLVSGVLAQYVAAPLRLPYLVFGVLLLLRLIAVALTREPVASTAVRPPNRPLRFSSGGDPTGYLAATAAGFGSFAVFALFTSLAPMFVGGAQHHPSHALAGLVLFTVFSAAAAAQPMSGKVSAHARHGIGLLAQAAGVVILAIGIHLADLATFLVGGIAAGIGAVVTPNARRRDNAKPTPLGVPVGGY